MAEVTGISWCDHTFNPWVGCTKISPACDHCYAETWDQRFGGGHWGPNASRRRTTPQNWSKVRKWNRQAIADRVRRRVFVASLADVFDNAVYPHWRADLWQLIRECPGLDFLLLTKRPQNIAKMLPPDWGDGWPNVWLGTTVENQTEADRRIPHLLAVPAAVRFLSCEPLLGPIDLTRINAALFAAEVNALTGVWKWQDGPIKRESRGIDWVICGGESGTDARPMLPAWARSLRDQCAAAAVAFFFKQWGEWGTRAMKASTGEPVFRQFDDFTTWVHKASAWVRDGKCLDINGVEMRIGADMAKARDDGRFPVTIMHRVGTAAAGDLLDGVRHHAWPESRGAIANG